MMGFTSHEDAHKGAQGRRLPPLTHLSDESWLLLTLQD